MSTFSRWLWTGLILSSCFAFASGFCFSHPLGGQTLPKRSTKSAAAEKRPPSPSRRDKVTEFQSGAIFLSAALGLLVALGPSAPAFAKYKDTVKKNGGLTNWGYEDFAKWRNVSPICIAGASQSPVDLNSDKAFDKSKDKLIEISAYRPIKDAEKYNANSVSLNVQGNFGSLQLPDGEYQAKQFHFHFPAEHVIDGKVYDGEMHIVHFRNNKGNYTGVSIAVIAVPLKVVGSNPIAEFARNIFPALANPKEPRDELSFLRAIGLEETIPPNGKTVPLNEITADLNVFKRQLEGRFFHYRGSLTTPPCTENVHWYVAEEPAPVTAKMVEEWRKAFPKNTARPVQSLNKRKVVESGLSVPGEFAPPAPKPPPAPKEPLAANVAEKEASKQLPSPKEPPVVKVAEKEASKELSSPQVPPAVKVSEKVVGQEPAVQQNEPPAAKVAEKSAQQELPAPKEFQPPAAKEPPAPKVAQSPEKATPQELSVATASPVKKVAEKSEAYESPSPGESMWPKPPAVKMPEKVPAATLWLKRNLAPPV